MADTQLTPADEIRAAADMLRNAIYPGAFFADRTVAALVRAHDPLTASLDRQADRAAQKRQELGGDFTEDALEQDTLDALAIARAMNAEDQ